MNRIGLRLQLPNILKNQIRCYDRQRYLKEKKELKKLNSQENVTLNESFQLLSNYALGQKLPIITNIKLLMDENQKQIQTTVNFPKSVTSDNDSVILVFATGKDAELAKKLGATYVGGAELIEDVLSDKIKFDRVLSTKQMFPQVIKIARTLGPKGLMPSPAKGTVSDDVETMMSSLKASTKLESNEHGSIQTSIGDFSWTFEDLESNLLTLVKAVKSAKPAKTDASKFIESVSIYCPNTPGLLLPKRPFKN
ncbi:ribosomal protein L1-like protein [Globomyces pollinis-pini]|nr:ribosomal protein L1-like protein [Globomyces pollinis-pini]